MGFLDWWAGLSPWLRYGVAILFLLVSTAMFFAGRFWPWGWGLGTVLLLFAGKSESEKKGYNF